MCRRINRTRKKMTKKRKIMLLKEKEGYIIVIGEW